MAIKQEELILKLKLTWSSGDLDAKIQLGFFQGNCSLVAVISVENAEVS